MVFLIVFTLKFPDIILLLEFVFWQFAAFNCIA